MTQAYKQTLSVLVYDASVGRNRPVTMTVKHLEQQANWGYLHTSSRYRGEIEWNGTHHYVFGPNLSSLACAEQVGEYDEEVYAEQ